jgi:hypothetical protein
MRFCKYAASKEMVTGTGIIRARQAYDANKTRLDQISLGTPAQPDRRAGLDPKNFSEKL